jgi:N-acetylglucosaminyl-diphospho-decaprenol L-rhamnosyltransferase
MFPSVSIVIVNWKTPELLAGCLRSIYRDAQANQFEIWVVDNNSQDGSVEMLERDFPLVKLVANKANVGFARACNQVIPFCTAPYVLLLNPDTVVFADAISKLAAFLEANADCAAVGPQVLNPNGTLQLACRRSFPSPAAAFYRLTYMSKLFPNNPKFAQYNLTYADPRTQLDVDALSGSCMMVRKSVIDKIGLLDEDIFMFGEDIDWCWRIKQDGWRVTYMPNAVVYHYHGASSRLRPVGATWNLHKGMEVFYRKHLAERHSPLFNMFVYAGIYLRLCLFVVLIAIQSVLRPRKVVAVFHQPAVEEQSESERKEMAIHR